jgi:hypothetical protein
VPPTEYKSDHRVTYSPEDLVYLNDTDGLRVSAKGIIHRADCYTQQSRLRPASLPWPKYGLDRDRPCKKCEPDIGGVA